MDHTIYRLQYCLYSKGFTYKSHCWTKKFENKPGQGFSRGSYSKFEHWHYWYKELNMIENVFGPLRTPGWCRSMTHLNIFVAYGKEWPPNIFVKTLTVSSYSTFLYPAGPCFKSASHSHHHHQDFKVVKDSRFWLCLVHLH